MIKKLGVVAMVLSIVLLTSCSNNDDDSSSENSVMITAEIDGVLYQSNTVIAAMSNGNRYFELDSANSDSSVQVRIGYPQDATAEVLESGVTYTNTGNDTLLFYQTPDGIIIGGGTEDTQITITSLDLVNKKISGTFSGLLYGDGDPKNLTNGVFTNISFTD